jgi:hypothetical protein
MASARPIVCSDIAGYRYAVGGGPDGGARLVAPGDVEGIAGALAELAADPALRARLGAHNRDYVRRFDWQELAERVREEYLAALASRGVEIAPRPAQSAPAVQPAEPVQSSPAAQPAPVEAAAADALV